MLGDLSNESRALGDIQYDTNGRAYQLVAGKRVNFIDYTLLLHDDVATLRNFVCTADTSSKEAKKTYFIAQRDWVDRKEGLVYAPSSVLPKLDEDGLDRLCEHFARNGVDISTKSYHFEGRNRKLFWRPYPLKVVYTDCGK